MDFFAQQDKARTKTVYLVLLFCGALVCITLAIFCLFSLVGQNQRDLKDLAWTPVLLVQCGLGTLIVVGLASLGRIASLSGGGSVVAQSLGGKVIPPTTNNPNEKRILNIVEEMAIASGTPVPPVYLIEERGINAFAAGYSPNDAVVGITRGCSEKLNREQLQGVVAHEFSHILNGDMRLNIRLTGFIFGIVFLSRIGHVMMRLSGGSRRRSSNNKGGAGLVIIGIGLFAIGMVGGFFGSLIRAAVSRQREFLADASAVQFTRNPSGIAGALKRIGGFSTGSKIQASDAGDYCHMFFGSALNSMFATHPPLALRIRKIEPNWTDQYPDTDGILEKADPQAEGIVGFAGSISDSSPKPRAKKKKAGNKVEVVDSKSFISSFTGPSEDQVKEAATLISLIPSNILFLSKEPFGARCVLLSLLIDSNDTKFRKMQIQEISSAIDQSTADLTGKVYLKIRKLNSNLKFVLIEQCAAPLKQLSNTQQKEFTRVAESLILVDQRIDLFEWSFQKVIDQHLQSKEIANALHGRSSLKSRLPECTLFLGALAHFGKNEGGPKPAFEKGFRALSRSRPANLPVRSKCTPEKLEAALPRLQKMNSMAKRSFLDACAKTAEYDGKIAEEEIQILRGLSSALACPVGPIIRNS